MQEYLSKNRISCNINLVLMCDAPVYSSCEGELEGKLEYSVLA